jgi:hypothetical protein
MHLERSGSKVRQRVDAGSLHVLRDEARYELKHQGRRKQERVASVFGDRRACENDTILFDHDGDEVSIASESGAALLLIAGVH